ncbi:MAG TPA: VOC family protein [Steroidobacteraceae bacterium]|nr:VOC family protein [Steroidobacteraceae bacterium]
MSVATATTAATAAPAGEVVAPGNFIHVVAHLDRTMAFYHGVLGLDQLTFGNAAPAPPKFAANAPVAQLYDVPSDTSVGVVVYRLPVMGVGLEFAEFRKVRQKSVHPQPQDPGASCVVLTVRQVDPILQRAHAAHVPIVSLGGVPVPADDPGAAGRSVVLRDPDGYYVELVEQPAAAAAATATGHGESDAANVLQAALMLSIADTDRNAQFYRDLLGMPLQIDASFAPDASLSKAFGLRGGQVRRSVASIPGSTFRYDFVEWKGVPRRATHAAVHDHGAGVLRLSVSDVDGFVSHLKAAGIVVDSTGGGTVSLGGTFHASILSDPNGLFIEPVPRPRARRALAPAPQPSPARP